MFKIFGYLKNSIPQVLLIIVLLIIQAWGDLTLPQYTSDIVDIGIQNGGIENAAADALSVDGYNALETFMNDEQKSILAKSYTLVKKKAKRPILRKIAFLRLPIMTFIF